MYLYLFLIPRQFFPLLERDKINTNINVLSLITIHNIIFMSIISRPKLRKFYFSILYNAKYHVFRHFTTENKLLFANFDILRNCEISKNKRWQNAAEQKYIYSLQSLYHMNVLKYEPLQIHKYTCILIPEMNISI